MNVYQSILALLNKPFHAEDSNFGSPKVAAIVSVFIVFFLYVFEPFGIDLLEEGKFLVCLGFGTMTFLGASIWEVVIGKVLKWKGQPDNWTLGKWILNNLGIMLTISLANFLFARLALFGYIEWALFPYMLYSTFMIGTIPIIALGGFTVLRQERKYMEIAREINLTRSPEAAESAPEEFELFDIPTSQIRYVQGLQNYVSIAYQDSSGKFRKKTERVTLKKVLEMAQDRTIVRAHRSFLVNARAIISSSGNAQGLMLKLEGSDKDIPVSRTYVASFRKAPPHKALVIRP